MSTSTLGRSKNHKIPHLHPHFANVINQASRLQWKMNNFLRPSTFRTSHFWRESKYFVNLRGKIQIFTQENIITQILLKHSEQKFGG